MIDHPSTAEARRRTHLEGRRARLAAQADALHERALDLWRKAWDTERGLGDALPIELEALAVDDARAQALRALHAIDRELRAQHEQG